MFTLDGSSATVIVATYVLVLIYLLIGAKVKKERTLLKVLIVIWVAITYFVSKIPNIVTVGG